jgi:hypothetical protein
LPVLPGIHDHESRKGIPVNQYLGCSGPDRERPVASGISRMPGGKKLLNS